MDPKDRAGWSHTLWEPLKEHTESPLRSEKEGIRVAAYCRISAGETNLNSLENQVSYFSNLIYGRKNWKFIGVYIDERKSGATISKRTGFQRMLRHAQEGKIDLILTKSVSRFSRNTKEILEVIQELKETKTTIYFERENLEVSEGKSSLMLETHAAMAQDFIESISNLVKFSYRKRLNEGRPYFGNMYGYDSTKANGKDMVKINVQEAKVIQWIFKEFIGGKTYAEISRTLNEMGVKTKKGNSHWSGSTVRKIIQKIEYTGSKLAMRRSKDLLTGKVSETDNSQEKFLISDSHPAIISKEIFEKAKRRVDEVTVVHENKMIKSKGILKNRIVCGQCGSKFIRQGAYNYGCTYSEPSVNLCDVEKLKAFDPQAMTIKALFIRMMNLRVEVTKGRKGIKYDIHDGLNRSEEELKTEFRSMLKRLGAILEKMDENDHLEFHRLRIFTQLEIARNKQDPEEIERIRAEYKAFEDKANKVEEDREFRVMAIKWLTSVRSIEVFIKSSTMEVLRAWMFNMTIYSRSAYTIEWIDGKSTTIGEDEILIIERMVKKNQQERLEALKHVNENIFETDELHDNESSSQVEEPNDSIMKRKEDDKVESITVELSNNWKQNSYSEMNADVIKLEGGLTIKDLGNLKKNILKNKFEMIQQNEKQKLRVAAYCRVSTQLEEQKLSLQTQLAYYNFKILSTPNWEFAGIYADEGLSGTKTERRDDFNRMLEDARKGKIDMIITKSVSRFSRNVLDVLKTVKMLSELKPRVSIFFEKEQIKSDDPHAPMILSLMATAAQEEVLSLSNSITWGIQSLAKRGEISRITDIYGYTIDKDRNWKIVDQEAKTVQYVFKEYAKGTAIIKIIDDLNKQGIKSPSGKEYWDYNSIKAMLMNEKYIGDYEFQKYYTPNPLGKKGKINKGQLPKYYIEKHHEPIIDKELFDSVQERIEANKKEPPNDTKKDGTAGRPCYYKAFTCAECGSLISRYRSTTYDSKEGSQWRCINSYQAIGSTCDAKMVPERYLDYNFATVLLAIKNDKDFRKRVETYLKSLALSPEEKKDKELLEKQMEYKNQQLYEAVDTELQRDGKNTNLINQITSDIIELREQHQLYVKRLEKLDDDRTRLEKLIKYCEKMEGVSFKQFHHMRPRINRGNSLYLTSKTARNSTYMDGEGTDYFPEECFKEHVFSGTMDIEGRIVYKLADGLEFGTDLTFDAYKTMFAHEKEKIHLAELLNSKEVLELKAFCRVGRLPKEMRIHLGIKSKTSFEKRIKIPLCEVGLLCLENQSNTHKRKYIWNDNESTSSDRLRLPSNQSDNIDET